MTDRPKRCPAIEHLHREVEDDMQSFYSAFKHDMTDRTDIQNHPDDEAVDQFAAMLKNKLAKARAKGRCGWRDPSWSAQDINRQMHEHAAKGDPLDVAAYAMFLALRGEATTAQQPAERAPLPPHEAYAGYWQESHESFADFLGGVRFAERAHGITLADAEGGDRGR